MIKAALNIAFVTLKFVRDWNNLQKFNFTIHRYLMTTMCMLFRFAIIVLTTSLIVYI